MSASKGYPSQSKIERVPSEYSTIEPVRIQQQGTSVVSHATVLLIGTDAVEANSTTSVINATGHAALKGDVISFTSGALSGQEVKVYSVTANTITLVQDLTSAPATAVTFEILRHKYPQVNASGEILISGNIITSNGPIQFVLDAVDTEVEEDTATPANSRPLPVKLLSDTGVEFGTSSVPIRIDPTGSTTQPISAASLPLPTGAATEATLSSIDTKIPAQGAALIAASVPVNIASDQTVPVSVASLPLPSGAATEATLSSIDTKTPALGAALIAASVPVNIASDQTVPVSAASLPLPSGAATEVTLASIDAKLNSLGQKAMAASVPVVIASDQSSIPVSFSASGNTASESVRVDFAVNNQTNAAWFTLIASTTIDTSQIQLFDSGGYSMRLATGAAASEVELLKIPPGGFAGAVSIEIPAGTRLSYRAEGIATVSVGELILNLLGV